MIYFINCVYQWSKDTSNVMSMLGYHCDGAMTKYDNIRLA
jgi:hypothetical protein